MLLQKPFVMRINLLLLFFSLFCFSATATIRTVSNLDAAAQFSTIQAACDASQSGDSIYVSPSIYNYAGFSINEKKLAVFGPGWSPFVGGAATIQYACSLSGTGASGSELHGLILLAGINIYGAGITNLIIYRNRVGNIAFYGSAGNCTIEGNWFISSIIAGWDAQRTLSNSIIRNNIFFNAYGYHSAGIHDIIGDSLLVDHNLFYGDALGFPYDAFLGCSHLTVTNNIIQLNCAGASFSTFNNNITYNAGNNEPWNSNNNINAGGNIAGQNPQMFDEASVDADVNNPLLDFTVKSGPANNSGSDGLDMGLLYDKGLVTNWNYSRAAHLPYITEFNITDLNIVIDGYIHFNGKAKSN